MSTIKVFKQGYPLIETEGRTITEGACTLYARYDEKVNGIIITVIKELTGGRTAETSGIVSKDELLVVKT